MRVSKKFKWEAAHRIPWYNGKCQHLHGHSYKMEVEFEGETDANGFVIDFHELKRMIQPLVEELDHTTIISEKDTELKQVFDDKKWKYFLLPFDSTAENLCKYISSEITRLHSATLKQHNITAVAVKIFETETSCATCKAELK